MSFIAPADVTDLVSTSLADAVIQDVIDREEDGLVALIGPLTGTRTETFLLTQDMRWERITLRRPTDGPTEVRDNAVVTTDFRLLSDQRTLLRLADDPVWAHGYWSGPLEVEYEPNDGLQVQRVLVELASIGIASANANSGLSSETTGTYSYTRERTGGRFAALTPAQRRRALYASLLPRQVPSSMHVRSSIIGQRPLLGTARPA
jgi:hypothetical protein